MFRFVTQDGRKGRACAGCSKVEGKANNVSIFGLGTAQSFPHLHRLGQSACRHQPPSCLNRTIARHKIQVWTFVLFSLSLTVFLFELSGVVHPSGFLSKNSLFESVLCAW